MNELPTSSGQPAAADGQVTLTHVIYALHAITVVTGVLTSAFILTAFLTGWPSILAVILNYVKRGEVRGTWLESHFRWQIRTFWFGLLWAVLGAITFIIVIGWIILTVDCIWIIYRIVKGWLNLNDNKPMYLAPAGRGLTVR